MPDVFDQAAGDVFDQASASLPPGPPKWPVSVKYIGPHDRPQDQPPLGFRPNEGYTPISKLGQNILPLVAMGAAAAPELGSAVGDLGAAARQGALTARNTPVAKFDPWAALGVEGLTEMLGLPKGVGAAVKTGISAAPKAGAFVRGATQYLGQKPFGPEFQATPPAPARSPLWQGMPESTQRGLPDIQPIPTQWAPRESPFPKINPNFKSAQPPSEATLSQPIAVHDIGSIDKGFKPMGKSSLVPHTQLDLPLKDAPTSSQRIGMHHIIQFANDNAIPFQDAYKAFAREGYIGDWNIMGP